MQSGSFQNKAVLELLRRYRRIWALGHASGVLGWDYETYMPEQGSKARGIANAELALVRQKFYLELKEDVERADRSKNLTDRELGVIRLMRRQLEYYTKVPPELIAKIAKKRSESSIIWRTARRKSDYALFKPHLKELLDLKREEADRIGYDKHPYNALLDRAEEGLTVDDMEKIFARLVPALKNILSKVTSEKRYPRRHPLESVRYEIDAMERVNAEILKILKMPVGKRFRMDVSTHPFTTGFAVNDVRITTRYEGKDFRASMYSTMHEAGHAIYALQVHPVLDYTPLVGGASGGIHESQSRFVENVVGRSIEFSKLASPFLKSNLKFLKNYSATDLYYYFNLVRPSLIRVDADELTYNFHIAVRFEIEKKLMLGDLAVGELPAIWSELFDSYLGIKPKKDSDGVLQDIHWSGGGFGGFPGYTIGNVVDGIIWHNINKDFDLNAAIRAKQVEKIKSWLGRKIHTFGGIYAPKDLLERQFNETYNPDYLVQYLEEKYLE